VTGRNPDRITRARAELGDRGCAQADARGRCPKPTGSSPRSRRRFGVLSTVFLNAGVTRLTPAGAVDEATCDDLCLFGWLTYRRCAPRSSARSPAVSDPSCGMTS